jgi:geranylgeranyl diphosphate synthase type I
MTSTLAFQLGLCYHKAMFLKIRNKIEKELKHLASKKGKLYPLQHTCPLLFRSIKDFILRKGKRVRPILFVIGYLGFKKSAPEKLYRAAAALELLHDFMLIHDDIIDKSQIRRNKLSMHAMLDKYLSRYNKKKVSGEDLAIVIGDILYAVSLQSFVSIETNPKRKEEALKIFIDALTRTGSGEFIELLAGLKDIDKISKDEIDKIYELKTAYYTFSAPLMMGAILAGANTMQTKKLSGYGIHIGRAFQINDDILDMFGDEKKIGKSALTDLKEAKKTLLIWYTYHSSDKKGQKFIKQILRKEKADRKDLDKIRKLIIESGGLKHCRKEISANLKKADEIIASSEINRQYKNLLKKYFQGLTFNLTPRQKE